MKGCNPSVLLVEDNNNDAMLAKMAMEEGGFGTDIRRVSDGIEAFEYLSTNTNTPDIILLDLNMPKMDGRQVLSSLRKDRRFDKVSVYVLTTSDNMKDIENAYNDRADCYIVKPMNVDDLFASIQKACLFWCNVVRRAH